VRALIWFADFLVATSVFTAFCALGLCMSTESLILGSIPQINGDLHFAIFGGTLVIYNAPRLLPRPYGKPRTKHALSSWYFFFFSSGSILLARSLTALPFSVIVACGLLSVFAFAYYLPSLPYKKRLRDYGIIKIVTLTTVWTGVTAFLPMMYRQASVADFSFELLLRFVFVFALCILFDIRDMKEDTYRSIATLPNRIGAPQAYKLVNILLLLFTILSIVQYTRYPVPERVVAATITAAVTALVVVYMKRHPNHKRFVAMTDGMMLLYAILVVL
jgi:1,4-dihydroxy-2-naphthoate octaprenyltransferase